jgi:hypothetical protein
MPGVSPCEVTLGERTYPLRWRTGRTAPSVRGLRNLVLCHDVASGPVSLSPSPTMVSAMRSGCRKRER